MEAVKVVCPRCGKRLFDLSVYNDPSLQNRSDSASHKAPEPNP